MMIDVRQRADVRTVVIVGNAPLGYDCGPVIDAENVVVRLNDCNCSLGRSGAKPIILCANNTGAPACRYLSRAPFLTHPLCTGVQEFLCLRD